MLFNVVQTEREPLEVSVVWAPAPPPSPKMACTEGRKQTAARVVAPARRAGTRGRARALRCRTVNWNKNYFHLSGEDPIRKKEDNFKLSNEIDTDRTNERKNKQTNGFGLDF